MRRLISQSIAFVYAPGDGMRVESDPLDLAATGVRKRTVDGVVALEDATLQMPEGIVLRYGLLYGPGTWFEREKRGKPGLHVDAAAQAALLAVSKGARGIYNIAEDDGAVSSEKAKRELGFDAFISYQILNGLLKNREPFSPKRHGMLDRLGDADARADRDLRLVRPRAQFERRPVERAGRCGGG